MDTTYKVRIWALESRKNGGGKVTSYRVRWQVGDKRFTEPFTTYALADSFRGRLLASARSGEAFHTTKGYPVSMLRAQKTMTWFELACDYMGTKWSDWSPKHRKTTARSLMNVTLALLPEGQGRPRDEALRKFIIRALNRSTRDRDDMDDTVLRWVRRSSPNSEVLGDPEVLRNVLRSLDFNFDGQRASANTVRLRRVALSGAIDLAVEKGVFDENPMSDLKVKSRKQTVGQVDPRSVVNPMQARMLLDAVRTQTGKPGRRLTAFFGCLYYAALRPEEACSLKKQDLSLPASGWGTIHLENARPEVDDAWTDTGEASEERSLKHRDDGAGRSVPCPPELTEMLHAHMETFGTASDGRLFRGARNGGRVSGTTYGRVWRDARKAVFTDEVVASPLGKRPYDLRHAAVSMWLSSGVEAPRVAAWAGHSLAVLLRVYAKCLDGGEQAARDNVARALRGW
ncbi:tyrosine-type recombinase/integrase [Haloechinothrix sp. YIM 98757]|uniref:Tyrosine-type recombinase/integrase n=1 Tax=Haloechinothrix aidingensis TaxID=2752311 RepID=A0A838A7S9_9PSEU|nr:tyrosine-type recombinase/integrase [Haloechinothrix aidingensis]MBA0124657.1 tyrosine-type recombinase/integrase [Haloechinothrix aidingensis]